MRHPVAGALSALVVLAITSACAAPTGSAATGAAGGTITVLAAASLTDAFADIAEAFSRSNPGVEVVLSHAGSQTLAAQILQGASADVFASADGAQMAAVADEGLLAEEPRVFATNRLAIAVERGNPHGITDLGDLDDPDLVLVLAAPEVPAGALAARALADAGVEVAPASLEVDVRAVLAKVRLGEADAGIVYASDVAAAAGAVDGVDLPEGTGPTARYPIAVLADAADPRGARAFVSFVLSEPGRSILLAHGFGRA
jgi:molybdate transport system substrate-binding protein